MLVKNEQKAVFMVDAGGKVRSAIASEPSNIKAGLRARLVSAVALGDLGTFPEGTLGTVSFVDHDTGYLYLDFYGEALVLMPFECEEGLLDAIRLHLRWHPSNAALAAG